MRHRVSHRKLGQRHRTPSRRCCGTRPKRSAARAHRDDGAEGQGTASLRRADHHHRQARGRRRRRDGKSLHARRMVLRDIQDRDVVSKLFDTIAPRFEGRPGGYTRILRIGFRRGEPPKSRRSSWSAASTTRTRKPSSRRRRRPSRRGSAAGCARRPSACAARRPRARRRAPRRGPRRRPSQASAKSDQAGRADTKGKAPRPGPAKVRRSVSELASFRLKALSERVHEGPVARHAQPALFLSCLQPLA